MLGLPYPGGPAIQRAADGGNPRAYALPARLLQRRRAAGFQLQRAEDGRALQDRRSGPARLLAAASCAPQQVADLAASFQEAVVDCLVDKAFAALRRTGLRMLCVGGGVAANARLRAAAGKKRPRASGVQLHVAPLRLCTDNAVMGAIAVERLKAGLVEDLDLDVYPGVVRRQAEISPLIPWR